MEGDTTNYYIFKKINDYSINFSTISRGFLLEIISNTQMKLRWEEVLLSVSLLIKTKYKSL